VSKQYGKVLVVDVGTGSVRAVVVRADGSFGGSHDRELLPDSPADGLVQFDATVLGETCLELARAALAADGPVDAVGISNQRMTVAGSRDRRARGPGPAGDLAIGAPHPAGRRRPSAQSVGDQGPVAPRSARRRSRGRLCFGTVDTWVAWTLSGGAVHVTDATNARSPACRPATRQGGTRPRSTGSAFRRDDAGARRHRRDGRRRPRSRCAADPALAVISKPPRRPGCVRRGDAKITFGTGGMLDLVLDEAPPRHAARNEHGTFPIVAWRHAGSTTWGAEAVMLAAGTNVQWLRDDLGLIASSDESHDIAASCTDTGGGVFVPAPTPRPRSRGFASTAG
jgi:glycerol kinase